MALLRVPACADLTLTQVEVPHHFSFRVEETAFVGAFGYGPIGASLNRDDPSGLAQGSCHRLMVFELDHGFVEIGHTTCLRAAFALGEPLPNSNVDKVLYHGVAFQKFSNHYWRLVSSLSLLGFSLYLALAD